MYGKQIKEIAHRLELDMRANARKIKRQNDLLAAAQTDRQRAVFEARIVELERVNLGLQARIDNAQRLAREVFTAPSEELQRGIEALEA